jgi:acetate---CoA ligase (ADP-forming)
VSRSEPEVQGLTAYKTVSDLPEPADLAALIIPAQFVPQELERCGAAGIRAAIILSSGFAEERGEAGPALQREVQQIAERYDMAVSGPNGEGFANTAAALCPTFSPAMDAGDVPLLPPAERTRGQVAVISQSGGMGFAFFDHGRPKELSFRYIVTTGNEACLAAADFAEFIIDEKRTDAILMLIEDIKNVATFERAAGKALAAGVPLIVNRLGASEAGTRAIAAHTAARGDDAEYRALFSRYGVIESNDLDEMVDIAAAFVSMGKRLPAGNRVAICSSSGGGGAWVADACALAGLDMPLLDDATRARIDAYLPPYGCSQNPVDVTAQAIHERGYAEFARLAGESPNVDGVILVVTGRHPRFLLEDRDHLIALGRDSKKPVLLWSYTRPAAVCVDLLSEAGLPLFTNVHNCARAMRVMADYRVARERFLKG